MRIPFRRPILLLCGVLLVGALAAGCSRADRAQAAARPAAPPDPMLVEVDAALAQRLTVGEPSSTPVRDTLRIAGRLEVDQYRTTRIGSAVAGRVTDVDVLVGQRVEQGRVLARISGSELVQAQLAYLRAHAQQQLHARAVDRARLLLSSDVIAPAELQRRENELVVASAEKRAAADQLRALGLPQRSIGKLEATGEIQRDSVVTASLSGVVIERRVALGQMVGPSDVLFVVSDLSSLWAQAEVPERDVRLVTPGQTVIVEIPALGNARIVGRITFVSDLVNPETRTVRVDVALDNRDRSLKPAMLATMLIEGQATDAITVPASAVVRTQDRDHVFVRTGPDRYRLQPVELGPEVNGRRPLLKQLAPGTVIVLDGAFHLNNAREQRVVSG